MTANEAFKEILNLRDTKDIKDLHVDLSDNEAFRDFIVKAVGDFMVRSLEAGQQDCLATYCAYFSTLYITGILHGIKMASQDIEAIK